MHDVKGELPGTSRIYGIYVLTYYCSADLFNRTLNTPNILLFIFFLGTVRSISSPKQAPASRASLACGLIRWCSGRGRARHGACRRRWVLHWLHVSGVGRASSAVGIR